MRTFNYVLLPTTDMSGDINTNIVMLDSIVLLALQAHWTGTPTGILKLQASNDGAIWSDITDSTVNVSGPGDTLYNLSEMGYNRLRLVYTRTSGSGSIRVVANGKGI